MDEYTLEWPADFEDFAWELEPKGWFGGLVVLVQGKRLRPVFYDPVRLSQEIGDALSATGLFAERCLIVVDRVTRESIEAAIARLAETGELGHFAAGTTDD